MSFLIFDTETNGFAKADYKDPTMPRVTQLAWKLFNSDGKCFKSFQSLIKPDGWTIPTVQELIAKKSKDPNFFVNNNMSTERCEREGKPIAWAMVEFVKALQDCKFLIAHNLEFDKKMMASEMYRLKIVTTNKPIPVCTMKNTTDILKIPKGSGYKYPSLTELHTWLFGKPFDGAHDAMVDVDACANSFFELKRRKLFLFDETGPMPNAEVVATVVAATSITPTEPIFISTVHDKPWLNKGTDDYIAQVEMLVGGLTNIEEIKQHFRLSRETEEKLNLIKQ